MARVLSGDLRRRVVAAVDGGMTRRAAAERFGLAPSTAIKWVRQWRQVGHIDPRPQGGDKRSHRIEAHAEEIFGLAEAGGPAVYAGRTKARHFGSAPNPLCWIVLLMENINID